MKTIIAISAFIAAVAPAYYREALGLPRCHWGWLGAIKSSIDGTAVVAVLATTPANAKPQSEAEACRDVKAARDLADGADIVMRSACAKGQNYTPENCIRVAQASAFAQDAALRENRKCKAALVRAGAASKPPPPSWSYGPPPP